MPRTSFIEPCPPLTPPAAQKKGPSLQDQALGLLSVAVVLALL